MVGATHVGRLSSGATRFLPAAGDAPVDARHGCMIVVNHDEPGGHTRKLHEKNAELGFPGVNIEIMKAMISHFKIVVAPNRPKTEKQLMTVLLRAFFPGIAQERIDEIYKLRRTNE